MKIAFALPILSLLFVTMLIAQDAPSIKYGGNGSNDIVEMSNMKGKVPYMKCWKKPDIYIGTIVKHSYEEDEMTISSFILKLADDKRIAININQDQVDLLGHHSVSNVASVLSQGKKVKVWAYECTGGGSGTFVYVDRVQWQMPPSPSKKTKKTK